jgi:hypothetical protein
MTTTTTEETIRTLNICREIEVAAPPIITFDAMLAELGPEGQMPDGTPFPMKLEAWPGGRWFRDLGDNKGHLWGHVQVIKPPGLIELCGPMFMSYPATNFVQYRLTAQGNGTLVKVTHRAIGLIPQDHMEGVVDGWSYSLQRIKEIAERRKVDR